MSQLLRNIDARSRLAGTNNLEILLFTLGEDNEGVRREVYGINVFGDALRDLLDPRLERSR